MLPPTSTLPRAVLAAAALAVLSAWAPPSDAADGVAARKLARKESCLRCHAVDKKKEGPSYQAVAYKYKGQADATDKLVQHITADNKVKLSDGHEEFHKITKTKDLEQVRNLIVWILSQ